MFDKNKNADNTNFWISYADLMAGLLFIFILLIGAIVTKSIILKTSLNSKEQSLQETQNRLKEKKSILTLKNEEIARLKALLLEQKAKVSNLSKKLIILQTNINNLNQTIGQKNKVIQKYKNNIIILSNQIVDINNSIKLKDEQIVSLLNKLNDKDSRYEKLIADLQNTKNKIKSLTGIKIKVIAALKEALGDRVTIGKNGVLRLSSKVLFDRGKASLKEESKVQLKDIFEKYIKTLVTNKEIKNYIDKIIIEGHTDSDGGYLYNLQLSQKRAYSVMNFLTSLDFAKKYDIKSLVMASGRSYLDPIIVNGKEDKEASRRIEIKFLLKNDEAMHEIEKILKNDEYK